MMNLRFVLANIYYQIFLWFLKISGRQERFYPTFIKIAVKICPDYYEYLNKPKKIICVMGTNGKTTVCNLLKDSLSKCGYKVIYNNEWSLILGITHMFAQASNLFNRCTYDYAIVETDELTSKTIYKKVHPDMVVMTNISRDSLKKNANSEYMIDILHRALPDCQLVLNCDDIISSSLKNNKTKFFGIEELDSDKDYCDNIVNDMAICPKCHQKLIYTHHRYNHIGKFECQCGFKNEVADFNMNKVDINNMTCEVNGYPYSLISDSIHNIYNQLAAISVLSLLGLQNQQIEAVLKDVKLTSSRFEVKTINDYRFITLMAKGQNPIACSSVFRYVQKDDDLKDILMMLDDIEDNQEGSETVSWLFETDFEMLNHNLHHITVAGKRRYDMLVRLLMAGIEKEKITIIEKEKDLVNYVNKDVKMLYLLHDIYLYDLAKTMKVQIEEKLGA